MNEFATEEQPPVDLLVIDGAIQKRQCSQLRMLRAQREVAAVERNLTALKRAAEGTENLMPRILDCVRSYTTLGEICDALRSVFGEYKEQVVI